MSCGTGSCCRTRRSPTTSTRTPSSPGCCARCPCQKWCCSHEFRPFDKLRAHSPDDPAMITTPDALLHRLEWRIVRRLDGRVQGGYRTPRRGSGLDFAGIRAYEEGDDARNTDWNVTARLDELQIREFNEDRELTTWLVLDRSASMAVGGAGRGKQDVLAELTLILARVLGRNGNKVGAVLYDGAPRAQRAAVRSADAARIVPPRTGRGHVLRIGRELGRAAESRAAATTDLAAMLEAVASFARRCLGGGIS